MADVEIKETMDEMKKLLSDFQDEHKSLSDKGQETSEALEKMGEKFAELTETVQNTTAELEAEKKAREELELALARGAGKNENPDEIKSNPEYKKAFDSYLRTKKSIPDDIIDEEFKNLVKATGADLTDEQIRAYKMLLVGSNPDGGYFVPVDRQSKIIKRIFETSPMRQIATVITTGSEAVEFVLDDGEFEAVNVGELDARGETDTSKIGIITIPVCENEAEPIATRKFLDDATINVEQWLQNKVADRIARLENEAFCNGTGAKEAEGFLALADWTTLGQYEREALETRQTAAASVFDGDDLIDLQSDLLEPYQAKANWTMHRKIWAECMKLKDADNQYLLSPQMLFAGVAPQILGRPVKMFGDMNNAVEDDAIIMAYGDFSEGYTIVDRIGIRVLRDPYTSKGFVKFYTTKRTGGGVTNYQAIKRLRIQAGT
jgi:HK97 family phage major capsid protein